MSFVSLLSDHVNSHCKKHEKRNTFASKVTVSNYDWNVWEAQAGNEKA